MPRSIWSLKDSCIRSDLFSVLFEIHILGDNIPFASWVNQYIYAASMNLFKGCEVNASIEYAIVACI